MRSSRVRECCCSAASSCFSFLLALSSIRSRTVGPSLGGALAATTAVTAAPLATGRVLLVDEASVEMRVAGRPVLAEATSSAAASAGGGVVSRTSDSCLRNDEERLLECLLVVAGLAVAATAGAEEAASLPVGVVSYAAESPPPPLSKLLGVAAVVEGAALLSSE